MKGFLDKNLKNILIVIAFLWLCSVNIKQSQQIGKLADLMGQMLELITKKTP